VKLLHDQGQIASPQIGINFEYDSDRTTSSRVTFGYFDEAEIQGGLDGMNYYESAGNDGLWALNMDDLKFDNKDLASRPGAKRAILDSVNFPILLPS